MKRKINLREKVRRKVEDNINNTTSFVDLLARLVITVICCLGLVTLVSALKEIIIEARTCLDEKFNMVTYTIGLDIENNEYNDITNYHMKNFEIGKEGFNAILYVQDGNVVDVKGSSEKVNGDNKEIFLSKLNDEKRLEQIRQSKLPFLFTKSGFTTVAPYMQYNDVLYKYRISKTKVDGIYIMSLSGQDEYIFKILRILSSAMLYTIIAVPLFIFLARKWLAILKEQLTDLENRIKNLVTNDVNTKALTRVIHSKNEIGKIAKAITDLTRSLDEKANIDQLTGIKNKRYLNSYLLKLEKDNSVDSIGIVLLDIDHFKYYNDTYGHLEGDIVLRKVAQELEKIAGKKNIVTRFGGEEFVIVARNATMKDLEKLCSNLVEGIAKLQIPHKASPVKPYVTISVGGALSTSTNFSGVAVVEKADKAVYISKETGRNKYHIDKNLKK